MRELPFGVNVTLEQEKIEIEKMRDALVSSLAGMTQAIPQMVMQGQNPSELVRKIAETIRARKTGKNIEDIIEEVFEPENPPAGAEEQSEQPVPAAPGVPPAGGAQAPQGRPDLQTLLSTMTGEGAGRTAVRTTRERPV